MKICVDDCTHLDSWMHRWDARYKLIALLGLMLAFATVHHMVLLPAMVGIVGLLYGLSRLPRSFLLSRLRYPGLFLLGVLLFVPWLSGTTPLWQWGPLTLWQEGCLAALLIAGRFLCSVTLGFIILGTTPFLTLIKAIRALGMPPLLADMMLLAYRYVFEILANVGRMRRAMTLRGFGYCQASSARTRQIRTQAQGQTQNQNPAQNPAPLTRPRASIRATMNHVNTLAMLTGTLFIRSYEQAERVYHAMRLRGYGVQRPVQQCAGASSARSDRPVASGHAVALVAVLALALTLAVWNYRLG